LPVEFSGVRGKKTGASTSTNTGTATGTTGTTSGTAGSTSGSTRASGAASAPGLACPPGLEARDNDCLPPGQEKKGTGSTAPMR
jgi:hypothetical protein